MKREFNENKVNGDKKGWRWTPGSIALVFTLAVATQELGIDAYNSIQRGVAQLRLGYSCYEDAAPESFSKEDKKVWMDNVYPRLKAEGAICPKPIHSLGTYLAGAKPPGTEFM